MAQGYIPYSRDFTVVTSGSQVGKGYAKDMEKVIAISPASAAVEIATSSAEGWPVKPMSDSSHKVIKPKNKKSKKSSGQKKQKVKLTGNRPEFFWSWHKHISHVIKS